MEWVVTLSGSAHVLEELSKVLDTPEICIQKDHDAFVLKSRDFADLCSDDQVRNHTTEILTSLNGVAKLTLGSSSPITIEHISEIRDDGTRHAYVSVASSIVVSATCSVSLIHADGTIHIDGTIEESHPAYPANAWMALSERDAHVKKALHLIGNDFETWYGLYKVFEIIREDAGNIVKRRWCIEAELKRFTQTANSPDALGVNARHAKAIPSPPNPMSLSSAKSFIRELINTWLEEKKDQHGL